MGIVRPRPAMRKREARSIQENLCMHDQFMRQLQEEGWDRDAASAEAYRMVKKIGAVMPKQRGNENG